MRRGGMLGSKRGSSIESGLPERARRLPVRAPRARGRATPWARGISRAPGGLGKGALGGCGGEAIRFGLRLTGVRTNMVVLRSSLTPIGSEAGVALKESPSPERNGELPTVDSSVVISVGEVINRWPQLVEPTAEELPFKGVVWARKDAAEEWV